MYRNYIPWKFEDYKEYYGNYIPNWVWDDFRDKPDTKTCAERRRLQQIVISIQTIRFCKRMKTDKQFANIEHKRIVKQWNQNNVVHFKACDIDQKK